MTLDEIDAELARRGIDPEAPSLDEIDAELARRGIDTKSPGLRMLERIQPSVPGTPAGKPPSQVWQQALRTGEMALAAVPALHFGGALLRSPALARGMADAARPFWQRLGLSATEPYVSPTVRGLAVRDVVPAMAGGAAVQAVMEQAPEAAPGVAETAGLAAGLGAGMVPAAGALYSKVSPVQFAGRLIGNVLANALPEEVIAENRALQWITRGARERASRIGQDVVNTQLSGIGAPEAKAAFREAGTLREAIPGFNPSVAEITGMRPAINAERWLGARSSGEQLLELEARRKASDAAVEAFAKEAAPTAFSDLYDLRRAMLSRPEAAVQKIEARRAGVQQAKTETQAEKEGLGATLETLDRRIAGQRARDIFNEARSAASDRMTALASELGINERSFVPFQMLQARVKKIIPSQFATGKDYGESVGKILGWEAGNQPTFRDVKFLRESIGDELRLAAKNEQSTKVRLLAMARDQIDEFLEKDWAKQAGLADRYSRFRDAYVKEFVQPFEQGDVQVVRRQQSGGTPMVDPEDLLGRLTSDVTAARHYKRALGGNPEAMQLAADSIIDQVRRSPTVVNPATGAVSERGLKGWLLKHQELLGEFPEVRQRLRDVDAANQALAERAAQLARREVDLGKWQRAVERSDFVKNLGVEPSVLIKRVMDDPATAAAMARRMTPEQRQTMGRAIWETIVPGGPEAIETALAAKGQNLAKFMGGKHLLALRQIAQAGRMQGNVGPPEGRVVGFDPTMGMQKETGMSPTSLAQRFKSYYQGRAGKSNTILEMLGKIGIAQRERAAERVLLEVLYNPERARELAGYISSDAFKKASAPPPGLRAWMVAVATSGDRPEER